MAIRLRAVKWSYLTFTAEDAECAERSFIRSRVPRIGPFLPPSVFCDIFSRHQRGRWPGRFGSV